MVILVAAALLGNLWHYELTMAPEDLEALYDYPHTETLYPAHVSCPAGESDCLAGFRGSTSLLLPKKSWRLELLDHNLIGRSHLYLDAQYRDLSMMRNHLAMELVRRMGYPAPLSRHVTLSINGESMGVYLETERVDQDFLVRNGLPEGTFFKALESPARFAPFLSGHPPLDGFQCRSGDEYGAPELVRLIGDVCWGGEFEGRFDSDCFMGNMAANLAMVDMDSCVKNYYLVLGSDGVWRYFPWDHDATFGNDWQGCFDFSRVNTVYYLPMFMNSLFTRILSEEDGRCSFGNELEHAADCMEFELPCIIDSLRVAIRDDVYLDPLRPGTPADFEEACDSLELFISERAGVVRGLISHHHPPDFITLYVSPGWITPDVRNVMVNLSSSDSLKWCRLWMVPDACVPEMTEMHAAQGSGGRVWTAGVSTREPFDRTMRFFVFYRQATLPEPAPTMFYPPYGICLNEYRSEALPAVVRVDDAPLLESLVPDNQLRLGPSLWALPFVNESGSLMDLSLCHVMLGSPTYRVFFPDSLSLAPGETLFVTNDLQAFSVELRRRRAVGDCAAPSSAGFPAVLFDPSWTPAASHDVPARERFIQSGAGFPLITELSYSQPSGVTSGDWLECHNPNTEWLDISHTGVSDSDHGYTVLPSGTVIPPGGFLILASEPNLFQREHPRIPCEVAALGFNLSSEGDTVRFISRTGVQTTAITYGSDNPWAKASEAVLSLIHPLAPPMNPDSWEVAEYPGTPGSPNPSWNETIFEPLSIRYIAPVPAGFGPVVFSVTPVETTVTVFVADLAGRIVYRPVTLEPGHEEHTLEMPPGLPSGMYFLVVRSGGGTCSGKLIWLP
ncbi:MAG: CotH kinase family protein [Candidatus Fermentibacteraceae bacterium]